MKSQSAERTVLRLLKDAFRRWTIRFGYAVFDLRKEQSPMCFFPAIFGKAFTGST